MDQKKSIDGHANSGAEEIPLPESHFREMGIASRATFYRWQKAGLRVLHVGGRRFIYPSELRRFLEEQNAAYHSDKRHKQ